MTTATLTTNELFTKINNLGLPNPDIVGRELDLLGEKAVQVNSTLRAFVKGIDADSEPDTVGATAGLLHLFSFLAQYDLSKINEDYPEGPDLTLISDIDENLDNLFVDTAMSLPVMEGLRAADPNDPLAIDGTIWAGPFERGVAVAYVATYDWIVGGLGFAGSLDRPHDYDVPEDFGGSVFSGMTDGNDSDIGSLLEEIHVPIQERVTQAATSSDRVLELLHKITQLTSNMPGVGSRLDKSPEGNWVVEVVVPNKSNDKAFTYFGTDVADTINLVVATTGEKPHVFFENGSLLLSTEIK